jgi:tetratricopeptide (TPR) repeat protein
MPAAHTDRNLLFGILALQMDFVSRDALVAAMHAWVLAKDRPLGDLLAEQGALDDDAHALLEALVRKHLALHDNDAAQSLAALSSLGPARHDLEQIADPDVQASLGVVASARAAEEDDPYATVAPEAVGQSTSVGVRFRILRPHAEGGLGVVSVARDEELHREVALKEIKDRYADHPQSRARFLLEAEVTGGLEHPGIVPVYGLGSYADGRPFYAMRFIRGDSLKEAVERFHTGPDGRPRKLTRTDFEGSAFRGLLGRFVDVCQAVAYAHSRRVLHRDLKPGNVMLGKYGETLVVDWGLAKPLARPGDPAPASPADEPSLHPASASGTGETLPGSVVGTPEYMSPEQAAGRWDVVGPASDIYGLGATLYAVLAGRPPVTGADVPTVLGKVERGAVDPLRQINPAVPPALDAVCRKALAMKPADRYASALDLAQDVERWLADEPVAAWREPLGARVRRWVRTHARLVTGTVAALVVGVGALGMLAWQSDRARRAVAQEQAETARERDEKAAALDTAQKRLRQIVTGNELVTSIFADLDIRQVKAGTEPLEAVLARRLVQAAGQLEGEAVGDPLAVAQLQHRLGRSLLSLGYPNEAIGLIAKARATIAARRGAEHLDTLTSMGDLASAYKTGGRLDLAIPLYEDALKLKKATLGPDHLETLRSMHNLASSYYDLGRHADALKLREETLALYKATLGPDHLETLRSMHNLASSYYDLGRHADALKLLEETLALRKAKLGPDHPDTLSSMGLLAHTLVKLNRGAEAVPIIDECLKRAAGKVVQPWLVPMVMDLRLRHFEKSKEASGCRATAEMWEKLNRADTASLYTAACMRAVTAAVGGQTPGADAARLANEDADRAMAWLRKALAAGYADIPHLLADADLAALCRRADYAELLWDLADTPPQ